jgi:hypothetical protein
MSSCTTASVHEAVPGTPDVLKDNTGWTQTQKRSALIRQGHNVTSAHPLFMLFVYVSNL